MVQNPGRELFSGQQWSYLCTIPGIGMKFALDPDGRILAIATVSSEEENSINLVDISDIELGICRHLHTLTGHSKRIDSLAFGSSGDITTLLASGDEKGTIKLWDVETGKELHTLTGHEMKISSVAFSRDMKLLASGSYDTMLKLWEVTTGREIYSTTNHQDAERRIHSIAFCPNNYDSPTSYINYSDFSQKNVQMLAIGTSNYMTLLLVADGKGISFNPKNLQLLYKTNDPKDSDYCIDSRRKRDVDGSLLVSSSKEMLVHCHRVNSVAFSPDGQILATAGNGIIRLWQISYRSGWTIKLGSINWCWGEKIVIEEICQMTGHYGNINSIAFSQDGRTLASGGEDKTIKLWEVATGKEIRTFTDDPNRVDKIYSVSLGGIGSGYHGEKLASSCFNTIKLRQVETGREIITLAGNMSWGEPNVEPIALSPDGLLLASGSFRWIQLWEVRTGRAIKILRDHEYQVKSLAFSPDGLLLASGGSDNIIKLWHVGTFKEIRILYGHTHTVNSLSFSPDGQLLASTSYDGTIRLWQVAHGRQISTFSANSNWKSVAFSPNGQLLAISTEYLTIKLWQVETGAEVYNFIAPSDFNSFAFSSNREFLAIATQDKTIKLLDVATSAEIHTFTASSQAHSISFSANGQVLAVGEYGGNIQIWQQR